MNIYNILNSPDCHTDGEMSSEMENMDVTLNYENSDLMSSDFFDSVLSLEQGSLDTKLEDGSIQFFNEDPHFLSDNNSSHGDEVFSPLSLCSDSDKNSVHTETEETVTNNDEKFDETFLLSLMKPDTPLLQEPEIENYSRTTNTYIQPQKPPTKIMIQNPTNRKLIIKPMTNATQVKKPVLKPKQQILRVQSVASNGRPVYLPFNVKSIKILNPSDIKTEPLVSNSSGTHIKKRKLQTSIPSISDAVKEEEIEVDVVSSTQSHYPPLSLTNEEKRLLEKEGIKLPSHYPLTKNEERELKRIRRKIRNKISAQDSRKRKKEYVDGLEERVKRGSEENKFLLKRIKQLQKQNSNLVTQLSKLQSLIFNSSTSKATPTTCLMIVLLSAFLVSLPNLRLLQSKQLSTEKEQVAIRRALLSSQKATEDDTLNMEEFLVFNKDDEIDFLAKFGEEIDAENITDKDFSRFLEEVGLKFEGPCDKNCSEKETLFRRLMDNFKSLFGKENSNTGKNDYGEYRNQKGFIEPDIDDILSDVDEGPLPKRKKIDFNDAVSVLNEINQSASSSMENQQMIIISTSEEK